MTDENLGASVEAGKARNTQRSNLLKVVAALSGLVLGLCLCGVPLAYLALSGRLGGYLTVPAGRSPTPNLPVAAIPDRLTLTPASTSLLSYDDRFAAAYPDIYQAQAMTNNEQYGAAIPLWDKIIASVPEYADAYYQRTRCYMHLAVNQRFKDEYIFYMQQSLSDMNHALQLAPTQGDYYYERSAVYSNLAGLELYRVDQDYWQSLSLADAQAAVYFRTVRTYIERDVALSLIDTGHYQEALETFSKLPVVEGMTLETDPGLQVGLAESYFGLGQVEEALKHLELAIQASPSAYKKRDRAIFLYSLGRLDEALQQINETIKDDPYYCGCRYYLRALIYYRQGEIDLAQADIDFGTGQTWDRGGLRSYVLGRMALDQGDRETGIALLQEAEASLSRLYGPVILKEIQQDLAQENAILLELTPHPPLTATPMPTPTDF